MFFAFCVLGLADPRSCGADFIPPHDNVTLCLTTNETACLSTTYGQQCFQKVLDNLQNVNVVHLRVYESEQQFPPPGIYGNLGDRLLNISLAKGSWVFLDLVLGNTTRYARLVSAEVNLRIGRNSTDADYDTINISNADFYPAVDQTTYPRLRVNRIFKWGGELAGFGLNAFESVTISGNPVGYIGATRFDGLRESGTWILGNESAYPPGGPVPAPNRIQIEGFSEPVRLILTGSGLTVSFINLPRNVSYLDYAQVGFNVVFNRNHDTNPYGYIEIAADLDFENPNVTDYLILSISNPVVRPRIVILEGKWPVGQNIRIQPTNDNANPDYFLFAENAGVHFALRQATRFYVGVPVVTIASITNALSVSYVETIRIVSDLTDVTVKVRDLGITSISSHFFSSDNGNLKLIVGDVPYYQSGNQFRSDGYVTVSHKFAFSGPGVVVTPVPTPLETPMVINQTNFDAWVDSSVSYSSLTVSENGIIHLPVGRVFFVNESHQFPNSRYYLVLEGSIPRYNASGNNGHPVLCGVGIVGYKFEVVFKNDPYYRTLEYRTRGELGEEKLFSFESYFGNPSNDAFLSTIQCVGYDSLALKQSAPVNPITYSDIPLGYSIRSFWSSRLYDEVTKVNITNGFLNPGLAVNVDEQKQLVNATLILGSQSTATNIVYLDSTALTPGHLSELIVNGQLQVLSVDQANVSWPASTLVFNVFQQHLEWSNFYYGNVYNLTLDYGNYAELPCEFNKVQFLDIYNVADKFPAFSVNLSEVGAEFQVANESVVIARGPGSTLNLSGWIRPVNSSLEFIKGSPLTSNYSFAFVAPTPTSPPWPSVLPIRTPYPINLRFSGNWSSFDSESLVVSGEYLNIDVNEALLSVTLNPAKQLQLPRKQGKVLNFAGVVTTGYDSFTFVDAYTDAKTGFDILVLNTNTVFHQCWNSTSTLYPWNVGCQPIYVKNLTLGDGVLYPLNTGIYSDVVTFSRTGGQIVNSTWFNFANLTVVVTRNRTDNPYFWFDDLDSHMVPTAPLKGEFVHRVDQYETGDDILARQIDKFDEFTFNSSSYQHLVCSSKFNCSAWLLAFSASAAQVHKWDDGSSSIFQLQCSEYNSDVAVGNAPTLRYVPEDRWEIGNFTGWTCLDYKEVVTGGSAGSPHADFNPSKRKSGLSAGAIAGIVIACIVVVAIIVIVIVCCMKKGKEGHTEIK